MSKFFRTLAIACLILLAAAQARPPTAGTTRYLSPVAVVADKAGATCTSAGHRQ